MATVFQTKTLKELQTLGSVLTDIADSALIYIESGNAPFVVTGLTLKAALAPPTVVDSSITVALNGTAQADVIGVIEKIKITATATGTVKVGTTLGGSEIINESVLIGDSFVISIDYDLAALTTIYFTGPASTLKLKIW